MSPEKHFDAKVVWFKPIAFGFAASLLLTIVYLAVLSLLNSFPHALQTFSELWFFMVPIIIGFGLQIALFTYVRNAHKHGLCSASSVSASAGASVASGSVSTASMVACCMHHITDVLPLVGLSAAVLFINRFQAFFLLLGVFSNAAGALMLLRIIKEHSLFVKEQFFLSKLMEQNLEAVFKTFLVVSAAVLLGVFLWLGAM